MFNRSLIQQSFIQLLDLSYSVKMMKFLPFSHDDYDYENDDDDNDDYYENDDDNACTCQVDGLGRT